MVDDGQHARRPLGRGQVERGHPPVGDRAEDADGVRQPGRKVVRGVVGPARDLGGGVDPVEALSQDADPSGLGFGGAHTCLTSGWLRAASVRARTTTRRPSSGLNRL